MMSSGKHGCKSRFDRISNLPDELVGHILSFLPTRCAVNTSILSTRWRYLFTLTNRLSFNDSPCFVTSKGFKFDKAQKRRFKEFVYKFLQLHQMSPIKTFSLRCRRRIDISDLNVWVSNAVQKGLQELHYDVNVKHGALLLDEVVACKTLVRLQLLCHNYCEIKIPLSASLPSLKILHLYHIMFFDQFSIQRLFSTSKLLEELTLDSCGSYRSGHVIISTQLLKVLTIKSCSFKEASFEIDAPNLAYLTYGCSVGVKIVPSSKYSCSLVKVELNFAGNTHSYCSLEYDLEIYKTTAYYTTELYLIPSSAEYLLERLDQEQMPEFHSLSKLRLGRFPSNYWKYVTELLDKSSKLETVIFEKGFCDCYEYPRSPVRGSLLPFSCHAQVIEVHEFCSCKGSLLLLSHLTRNARFLKKLIVVKRVRGWSYASNPYTAKIEMKINKDLMELPRASSDCCIELK